MKRRAVSPTGVVLASAMWMASIGNVPLWRKLAELGLVDEPAGALFTVCLGTAIFGALTLLLALFAWRGSLRLAATLLLIVTAGATHLMLSYGIVIDTDMMTNALQTDVHEVAGLASWRFAAALALLAGLPSVLLWWRPIDFGSFRRQAGRNLLLMVLGVVIAVAALLAGFQTLASVMRNHKDLRYLVNPLATIYSLGRVASRPLQRDDSVLVPTGVDAHLRNGAEGRPRPPMVLLVLGETGRSGNFSLNGYARPTTPGLEREPALASLRNAWSCGTSTALSVPCMFSPFGRHGYVNRKHEHEGLLDVLQRAGLAVLWIDNQSGCKGVCDRIPSVNTSASAGSPLCAGGECLDGIMLEGLDERVAGLDPKRAARGVVLVMHQMGSHGPAYHLRSPPASKRFMPECTSAALNECTREEVVNAYDNSIVYTDHFLAETIAWLKGRADRNDTAMIYVADHGESLGENNLYLHGMPYALAPDVQKRVPWITWLSEGFQRSSGLSLRCLQSDRERRVTHDNYFHSVLGIASVDTTAYRRDLDVYAGCSTRQGEVAPAKVHVP